MERRARPQERAVKGDHELFGFLTTEANAIVAPIHPKAMPAILTTPAEVDEWLETETSDALALQRPLPDGGLRIVAKGEGYTWGIGPPRASQAAEGAPSS
jgi:putative SOS response-associated peptidase YedK